MGARTASILMAVALLAAAPAAAQSAPTRRGPLPSRDEWLLAQPMLTLPAAAPDPLDRREVELRFDGDWGSDFAWVGGFGGPSGDLRYLVDGEHRSGSLTVRRGFGGGVTLGLRVPVLWRGPGILDGVIDWWHRALGFPDGGRSFFPDDQFRVEGRDPSRRPIAWKGRAGTGLGNLELELQHVITGRDDARRWRTALGWRASVPTATGPFSGAGGGIGAQWLAAHPLGSRADVYTGAGLVLSKSGTFEGLAYRRARPQGFLALEARLTRGWSAIAQLDVAGRLVTNLDSYPGSTVYLRVGSKFGLRRGWMLEGGITEGLIHQVAATDFGFIAAVGRRF
jgi:Protein of unknown function (DUF3187)